MSLSKPSKMPCHGYGLSAFACKTGTKLASIPGSVCAGCYAKRGNYTFRNVQSAQNTRLLKLLSDTDAWVEQMVGEIALREKSGYFRWHDSGDLQSAAHLEAIAEIARRLPTIKFWLPTKEYTLVQNMGQCPANLIIRVSHPMVGRAYDANGAFAYTSSVASGVGYACPASKQGNKCLECRACWDKSVKNVDYHKH